MRARDAVAEPEGRGGAHSTYQAARPVVGLARATGGQRGQRLKALDQRRGLARVRPVALAPVISPLGSEAALSDGAGDERLGLGLAARRGGRVEPAVAVRRPL